MEMREERRGDRGDCYFTLFGHSPNLRSAANKYPRTDSVCQWLPPANEERWPSIYTGWRQPVVAFFDTVVTSDSVGAGVIAQHEPCTLLSRFRHFVTSLESEI